MSSIADVMAALRIRGEEASFIDRIEEVRRRLIWSAVTVALGAGAGFVLAMKVDVLGVLTAPIEPFLNGTKLQYLDPMEPFYITLKLGIAIGLLLALPVILHHAWALISPLLRPEEKSLVRGMLLGAVALFLAGVALCFLTVIPLMLRFTMGFQTESLEQGVIIGRYLGTVLKLMLVFGLVFQLPILILLGTLLGILTPEMLTAKRRHAILIAVVLGALLTPPDIASQTLMAVPLYLLYEVSIVVARLATRGSRTGAEV